MRTSAYIAAGLIAFGCAGLSAFAAQQPQTLVMPRPTDTGPDTFVASRDADQQARRDAVRSVGEDGRLVAMRAIVRAHFRAPQRNSVRITNSERLDEQDAEEVALFLTMLGYDPSTLQGQSPAARELVSATIAVLFGASTLESEVRVAPNIYRARLRGVTPDASPSDGYRSTAQFEVLETLKGLAPPSGDLKLRQRSGPSAGGLTSIITSEFQPGQTGEFILFASPSMYGFRAKRKQPAPEYFATFLLPYQLVGGVARAWGDGQHSAGFSVERVKQLAGAGGMS